MEVSGSLDIGPGAGTESEVRVYARAFPAVFARARGAELYDIAGQRYIDFFCGAGALNYGHNDPGIRQRLIDYLVADGIVHALDAATSAKRHFLTRLRDVVLQPRGLPYKVQFTGPAGSDANEAAMKLARKVTGRTGLIAFSGSFHGMTHASLAASGDRRARAAAAFPLAYTTFVPYADGPGGPFDSVAYIERLLNDTHSGVDTPAAVLVEAVQMDGGVYRAPAEWLRRLRELTAERDILLVCDEVQAGCGRCGSFFSFEHAGVVPDVVTVSKSIGGYGLPLALCLIRPELDVWAPGEHTGTFRANQLALVAGAAALDFWCDPLFGEGMTERARVLAGFGERLEREVGGVTTRGIGMVLGIDGLSEPGWIERAQKLAFEGGLIVERCGRRGSVLKVAPPLTIEPELLQEGLEILRTALTEAQGTSITPVARG